MILAFALLLAQLPPSPDLLFADFEGVDYGAWTASGAAFGDAPARGTLPGQMQVTGFHGHGLVNSYRGGDGSIGSLLSPEFPIAHRSITFLIGGGGHVGKTCIDLLVDGVVVRTACGPNLEPGGSEALSPGGWDVADLRGKTAQLRIVDEATGGWGHINVDDIVFTDREPPTVRQRVADVQRELVLDRTFLHLPVRTGAPKHKVALLIDGAVVRQFEIELTAEPEWFADLDVSAWRGKTATLKVDALFDDDRSLAQVALADARWHAGELHKEPLRPLLHYSPPRGWTNDPNGMVWSQGAYHLFYQHNPYGWAWGNMHWGHAESRDLVHWQDLPIALYPRQYGDWVYSGSAVVDADNTSGWKSGAGDLLVAAYTSTGRGECIAHSEDGGRSWIEFDGNPVLRHQGRDPRLLWYAPGKHWVMAVYDEWQDKRWIAFCTSPDLKTWTFRSRIEGFFECPDLFALPLDGDGSKLRWVLTAASSEYRVGSFDGATFTPETGMLPGHRGRGFYAAQTFSQEPKGRVVQLGWMQAATPGMPFNQCMSLPHELSLRSTAAGPRLGFRPVPELQSLRGAKRTAGGTGRMLAGLHGPLEVHVTLRPEGAARCVLDIDGVHVEYDPARGELDVAGARAPLVVGDGRVAFTVFTDRSVVELFSDDGLLYMPVAIDARQHGSGAVAVAGGSTQVDVEAYELRSIW